MEDVDDDGAGVNDDGAGVNDDGAGVNNDGAGVNNDGAGVNVTTCGDGTCELFFCCNVTLLTVEFDTFNSVFLGHNSSLESTNS